MKQIHFHPFNSAIGTFILCCMLIPGPGFSQVRDFTDLNALIPVDPTVIKGTFENGFTYYIKTNKKPENRASLWLVVNTGSVLEDEDQRGLAHFVEHMAFNGTKNFARHELINYLESIGMQFGPEINAYTSFDETVYMLEVPTDNKEYIEQGFQILEDWAHQISFEPEEIDKERGVIIEEWRLGRDAEMRMLDKQLPILFKGSRYAERLPIGKKEILESFDHSVLTRFYKDWYRPDLMAIIAVGDFNEDWIKELIEKHFSGIPVNKNDRERSFFPVPDHDETLFATASDPEASRTTVSVYYKCDPLPRTQISDYRRMLTERLYTRMLNIRLYELLNQAEPPYLFGYSTKTSLVKTKSVYALAAAVNEDGLEKGLTTLLTESARVRRFGFTQSELDRAKYELLREIEQYYKEKDKTESQSYAGEYQRNFLEEEPIPGIQYEYELSQALVPGISLDEINNLVNTLMTEKNRVVMISAPEREVSVIPGEDKLLAIFSKTDQQEVEAYVDEVSDQPLITETLQTSKIKKEKLHPEPGIIEWKLSNGIRVILKPTDFKNDEIHFQGFSTGGTSLLSDADYKSGNSAADVISLSGVGEFDLNDLNKKLTGKVVTVFPFISELTEGVIGNASPEDMETMFQLIYLYMTAPRRDTIAFRSYQARMKGYIENRSADPEAAFNDTIMVTLADYHPRQKPWSTEILDQLNYNILYNFYRDRFADAGDFTFIFVGNFTPEIIKPLVTAYLGSLPSIQRKETWKDNGLHYPAGVIKKTVIRGIEPRAIVSMNFTGMAKWSRENNYVLQSLGSVLDIKLREVIREDKSGTYGVSVSSTLNLYPKQNYKVTISFGCDPDRTGELINSVFHVIDSIQTYGPADIYIKKVSETQLRSYEVNLKENTYWLRALQTYYFRKQDPGLILKYPELAGSLTPEDIKKAAVQYLNRKNYVEVVLLPEKNP